MHVVMIFDPWNALLHPVRVTLSFMVQGVLVLEEPLQLTIVVGGIQLSACYKIKPTYLDELQNWQKYL